MHCEQSWMPLLPICAYMHVSMNIITCMYAHTCMHVSINIICMYACMYVCCLSVHTCMYPSILLYGFTRYSTHRITIHVYGMYLSLICVWHVCITYMCMACVYHIHVYGMCVSHTCVWHVCITYMCIQVLLETMHSIRVVPWMQQCIQPWMQQCIQPVSYHGLINIHVRAHTYIPKICPT